MSNYVKLATDAGDQYLTSLAEMQENFLKTTTALAARFTPVTAGRDAAGLRPPRVPDGAGSHGGELRLRAEAAEAAEELRREAAGRQHARREVTSHARRGGGPSPPGRRRAFRRLTRLQYHTERKDALGVLCRRARTLRPRG